MKPTFGLHRFFAWRAKESAPDACARKALRWIRRHTLPGQGVLITSRHHEAYPEVSGYTIPTLLAHGEEALARQYARWLIRIQNPDGSWNGPDARGKPYTFDVGQVLRGLIAIVELEPEAGPAMTRGCDWLASQIDADGVIHTPASDAHQLPNGKYIPDAFHLYTLPPLREAAVRWNRPDWADAVDRAVRHYAADPKIGEFQILSHFHAYIVEALVDLDRCDIARPAMAAIEAMQRDDGSVPGWPDVAWICSTGLAQYALIWLKLGRPEPARRAFEWLCRHQNRSGGFFGSYGERGDYFPDREISWAAKYFLDVYLMLKQDAAPSESEIRIAAQQPDERSALVSIVLPTFNGAKEYLQPAIDSCLSQTHSRIELILVDDCSTAPETIATLDGQTDPRIRIVRHASNRGLPAALNTGFREAHGDLLTWTSDDNLFRPQAIARMAAFMRESHADFVYARAGVINEYGNLTGAILPRPADRLIIDNCIGPCFLFTRAVREQTGWYDPEQRLVEDYDYWVRVSRRFRMERIDEDLYLYRQHEANLTAREGRKRIQRAIGAVRRRHFPRADLLAADGLRAFDRGDMPAARRLLLGALALRPWRVRLIRPALIALLPPSVVGMLVRVRKIFLGQG